MDGGQPEQNTSRREFFSRFIPKRNLPPYSEFKSNNPDLLPSDRIKKYKTISRRNLLLKSAYSIGGLAIGSVLAKFGLDRLSKSPIIEKSQTEAEVIKTPTPEAEKKLEDLSDKDLLDNALAQMPGTEGRKEAEKTYLARANTIDKIDLAFMTFCNWDYRKELLDRAYELRQNGNIANRLPNKLIEWAKVHHKHSNEKDAPETSHHPESVANCWEMEEPAKKIIQALLEEYTEVPITVKKSQEDIKDFIKILKTPKDQQRLNSHAYFRPDLARLVKEGKFPMKDLLDLKAEDIMLNIGGMTELGCRESGVAFQRPNEKDGNNKVEYDLVSYNSINIGTSNALSNIDLKTFPTAVSDLHKISTLAQEATGQLFLTKTLPGSRPTSNDQSGGAIGAPQMMPEKVMALLDFLDETKERKAAVKLFDQPLLPFDRKAAIVLAWIIIARGEGERAGYLRGKHPIITANGQIYDHSDKIRWNALDKWNRNKDQIEGILEADQSFASI